ncbi:MAG: zf-HC2 domain-containing protein [bacterium]
MKCEKVEVLISAHLDGEVTPSDWQEAQAHIQSCVRCAETLRRFEHSTRLFQQTLSRFQPAHEAWTKIESRLQNQPSSLFARWCGTLRHLWEVYIVRPPAYIRTAQITFAVAVIAFMFFIKNPFQTEPTTSNLVKKESTAPTVNSGFPAQPGRSLERTQMSQPEWTEEIQNYFEQTAVLLMEIKNSEPEKEAMDLASLRSQSQKLLEKSVLIKNDLQDSELTELSSTVEQLQLVLMELANLKEKNEKLDIEMLKAIILKQDILIKIEIFDLKSFEKNKPFLKGRKSSPLHKKKSTI